MKEAVGTAFEKVQLALRELAELCAPVPADELAEVAATAQTICNIAEALRRLTFDQVSRSGCWEDDGFRSAGRWLAQHTGAPAGTASVACRQAAALRSMPHSHAAAIEGALHAGHIEALTACRRAAPDAYTSEVDERLVALAGDAAAFRAAVVAFRRDASDPHRPPRASTFSLSERPGGGQRGSLHLDDEDAAIVHAALDRRIAHRLRAKRNGDSTLDGATIAQLRAQALVDLCDADLRRDPDRRRAPDRHRIAVMLQADAEGNIAPVGHLPTASTCDAELFRLVLGAEGEVLDVGRATRTWSAAQADGIIRRDGHCVFPAMTPRLAGATSTTATNGRCHRHRQRHAALSMALIPSSTAVDGGSSSISTNGRPLHQTGRVDPRAKSAMLVPSAADLRARHGEDLKAMNRTITSTARRRHTGLEQQPVEVDALVAAGRTR
ncbi:MAG: hypothetical protein R2755_24350 [Acidimicrobiales bacterium]